MFADVNGDAPTLRLVWAHEGDEPGYIVIESEIEGEQYPPLSDIAPAAFVEECEIYEQFGIRPAGGKPLNRLMLPPHAAGGAADAGSPARAAAGRGARPALRRRAGVRVPVRAGPPGRGGEPVLRAGDQRRGSRRPVPVHLAQAPRGGMAAARQDHTRGHLPRRTRRGAQRRRGRLGVRGGGRSRGRRHAAARGRQDPGGRARARAAVQPRRGHGGAVPGHRAVGGPGRGRDRAGAAAAGQRRRVRPPVPVRRHRARRGQPGARRRRAPPRAARRLRRAAPRRRCAAGHELLRRPAGGLRDPDRRAGPPPRPGRPGRAGHRAGHRRPAGASRGGRPTPTIPSTSSPPTAATCSPASR